MEIPQILFQYLQPLCGHVDVHAVLLLLLLLGLLLQMMVMVESLLLLLLLLSRSNVVVGRIKRRVRSGAVDDCHLQLFIGGSH